ncbi:hypothetical protein HRV97_06580 [Sphingomonas sp. HHU CXW]|uniref:Antitoxin Xre/MbcA/ParS-like toxin-binding domain-containing protein n=1 Tax=Sphingomonas hominis TaxID=2741495 RepID=A0ABX2JF13_9SPHN|nr:hypothetical protein [Sphingomonas hominis]NTS64822.1 hypothetical protein [Sphingomonas hominis]
MSDEDTTQPPAKSVPATRRFRPARVAMDRGAAARQGRIAQLAFVTLGDRDAAMTFLNTHDDALGSRPIDAAIESDDGLARAEQALTSWTRPAPVVETVPPAAS